MCLQCIFHFNLIFKISYVSFMIHEVRGVIGSPGTRSEDSCDSPPYRYKSESSFFFSFLKIYLLFIKYSVLHAHMPAHQKRTVDLTSGGCELPCGCWELNSGPLVE